MHHPWMELQRTEERGRRLAEVDRQGWMLAKPSAVPEALGAPEEPGGGTGWSRGWTRCWSNRWFRVTLDVRRRLPRSAEKEPSA